MKKLAISQAIGQLSILAVMPFLTRLYDPGNIGEFQLAYSISIILSVFFSCRLELLIPRLSRVNFLRWFRITKRFVFLSSGIALLILFVVQEVFDVSMRIGLSATVVAIAMSYSAVSTSKLIYEGEINRVAVRNVSSGVFSGLLQVLGGLVFPSLWFLMLSMAAGRVFALLATHTWRQRQAPQLIGHEHDGEVPSRSEIIRGMFASALGNLSPEIPLYFIGAAASTFDLGQFALARRASVSPASLLGQGLIQDTTFKASSIVRSASGSLYTLVIEHLKKTAAITIAVSLGLALFGLFGTTLVFGSDWKTAGIIIAILSPTVLFSVSISPLTAIFPLIGLQKRQLQVESIKVMFTLTVFFVLVISGTDDIFILSISTLFTQITGQTIMLSAILKSASAWDASHKDSQFIDVKGIK